MNLELDPNGQEVQKLKKDRLQQLISTKPSIGMGLLNSKAISGYLGGFVKFSSSVQKSNEISFQVRVDRAFYSQYI